jgi:hypothetical protein
MKWRITLRNYKGERREFHDFSSQMEAENFAHQQVNGSTEWEIASLPATAYDPAEPSENEVVKSD